MEKEIEFEGLKGKVVVDSAKLKRKGMCPSSHEERTFVYNGWRVKASVDGVHIGSEEVRSRSNLKQALLKAENLVLDKLKANAIKSTVPTTEDFLSDLGYK